MVKDSFFIRASLLVDDTSDFSQTEIDLGAYVDALGEAVLRIHNVEWALTRSDGTPPNCDAGLLADSAWQLTTQSQIGMVTLANKSVIASGAIWAFNPDSLAGSPSQVYTDSHSPQHYTNGYLVATEQIYLGGIGSSNWGASDDITFSVMLECTVEKMSKNSAIALALSQQ
tara:strand:- start:39 stop:551 length:513 start_codon:yes stop_codon:yes gene_type:complete